MKKRNARKGFTIVELVIVIAVIAILAAVLIPTFSGVVDKANASAAYQDAKNAWTEYLSEVNYAAGDKAEQTVTIVVKDGTAYYTVAVTNGKLAATATKGAAMPTYTTVVATGDTSLGTATLENQNASIVK